MSPDIIGTAKVLCYTAMTTVTGLLARVSRSCMAS